MLHYIDRPDETLKRICSVAFPEWRGKKIKLDTDIPSQLNSYWDGGSKDTYVFVELATMKTAHLSSNHPFFEKDKPRDLNMLPIGMILVKHSIFCGKDAGITIYANAGDLVPLLPAKIELTDDENAVLYFTRVYKSSYAGIADYRFHEASWHGITKERWETAKMSCVSKGLLNKAGAITASGKNAALDKWPKGE